MLLRKDTDYNRLYEQKRRQESSRKKRTRRNLGKIVRRVAKKMAAETGIDAGLAWSAIRIAILRIENRLSYRRMVTHLESNPDDLRRCGLSRTLSKSTLHNRMTMLWRMGKDFMDEVVLAMSEGERIADLHGDSTGFGLRKYKSWSHAKHGEVTGHDFAKLHAIAAIGGKILSFEATPGTSGDSPEFARMMSRIPKGGYGIVALDSAYDSYKNCELIAKSGRGPVIKPAKGHEKPRGFSARAKMLRWLRDRPDEFWQAYHKRSQAESLFSVMKERAGSVLRAKLDGTITVELFARVLCYNLTV